MTYRKEHDSMGEVLVEEDKLWKAQTQRSLENFKIGSETMPMEIIYALAIIKKSAAYANYLDKKLDRNKYEAIDKSADDILAGKYDDMFPLSVWQTGSGTQTNMNVNEVISSISKLSYKVKVHPNDHVNKSQSTNDVFPSAIHIATYDKLVKKLLPEVDRLIEEFARLEKETEGIVKIGRTHLQDATPIKLSQELSGHKFTLIRLKKQIKQAMDYLLDLAIGATAVGTGLNTSEDYAANTVKKICDYTGYKFRISENKFYSLASKNELALVHSSLNNLANELLRIGNDIRFLGSGPRAGLGEYILPSNEPGSSIMPGKVNPTQVEALSMVCARVMGNNTSVLFASCQGNFQLNVYMPLIGFAVLNSIDLLAGAMESFRIHLLQGLKFNEQRINENLMNSLMLVTALSPEIGYEKAAELAKYAHENDLNLFEANDKLKFLEEDKIKRLLDPKKMV